MHTDSKSTKNTIKLFAFFVLLGSVGEIDPILTTSFACNITNQGSISSTFYMRIFRSKACSKPNSKHIKAAQKTFVQKMSAQNVDEIDGQIPAVCPTYLFPDAEWVILLFV